MKLFSEISKYLNVNVVVIMIEINMLHLCILCIENSNLITPILSCCFKNQATVSYCKS